MTADWYPTIDTGKCKDSCFACVTFCPHKAYEKQGKKPIVANPDACIKGCDSYKTVCPVEAIAFLSTRMITVDGVRIGIDGLDEAVKKHKDDFDAALEEICSSNYVPQDIIDKFKKAIRKEFEKGACN